MPCGCLMYVQTWYRPYPRSHAGKQGAKKRLTSIELRLCTCKRVGSSVATATAFNINKISFCYLKKKALISFNIFFLEVPWSFGTSRISLPLGLRSVFWIFSLKHWSQSKGVSFKDSISVFLRFLLLLFSFTFTFLFLLLNHGRSLWEKGVRFSMAYHL